MPKVKLSHQQLLGLRIKELRSIHSVTQEELAERTGMFRTYMSLIECGRANPTLTILHTLADALEVPIADLFIPAKTTPTRVRTQKPLSRGRVR